jgi:hypothetical protein
VEASFCHTQKLRQLFENDIGGVHASERKVDWRLSTGRAEREYLGILALGLQERLESSICPNRAGYIEFLNKYKFMTFIPARVLAVDKQEDDRHRIIVRIELRKYRGSFNTLKFGENKPFMGSCHDGRLDLIYYQDPGLNEGESFPLWTVQ